MPPVGAERASASRVARDGRAWLAYAAVLLAVSAVIGAAVAAPWLATHGHPLGAYTIYAGFKPACHQIAERSFWVFDAPMAVCSRCFSIYSGVTAGLLAAPLVRGLGARPPRRRWLVAAAVPAALDFGLGWLGIVENTFASRAVTGVLLGATAAFYLLPGLVEALVAATDLLPNRGKDHGPSEEETGAR